VKRGAFLLLALAAMPLAAQNAVLVPPPPRSPDIRVSPVAPLERHPRQARAERIKTVDIPQAAKDAGHNGSASFTATIGADGKLVTLALKQTSMSPAIDAAVEAAARKLYYFAATDKDGTKVQGTVDVVASYARHDSDSPGGGIETYTCGDLVREYDWFTAANAGRRKLFWPQNAYVSLASVSRMLEGEQPSRADRLAARKQREDMWAKLIKRCRKAPEQLMLAEVDQPDAYARLVNSF
jgi:TonB family protein